MASFNKVLLLGNLTRDPQTRYLPSNQAVTDFGLACNRRYKTASGEDREEVTFVDITAFGRQAEVIQQYCKKGRPIFIEGRLKYDTWEDKQGGGKRHKLSVVVENFQLLGSREGGGGGGGGGYGGGDASAQSGPPDEADQRPRPPANRPPTGRPVSNQRPPEADQPGPIGEEQHFKDDDIPF